MEAGGRVSDAPHLGRRLNLKALQCSVSCPLVFVSTTYIRYFCFPRDPIKHQYSFLHLLFDSVPTRFCLGTWHIVLSSPLLVTWKSNPLGPRLNALSEIVVIRVLNQVAHVYRFIYMKIKKVFWLCRG
jgi:hypothetical protein